MTTMTCNRTANLRRAIGPPAVVAFLLLLFGGPLPTIANPNEAGDAQRLQKELLEQTLAEVPAADDPRAVTLLEAHWRVVDPARRWVDIEALRYRGTVREGRVETTAEKITASPNRLREEHRRRHLGRNHHDVVLRDGAQQWQQTLAPQSSAPRAEPEIKDAFQLARDHHGLLFNPSSKGIKLSYAGKKSSRGRPQKVVQLHFEDGTFAHAWFDDERGVVTRLTRSRIVGNSVLEDDIFFTSYRRVAGVWVADEIEYMIAGQLRKREKWDSIEVLPAVETGLFRPAAQREIILRQKAP